MSRPILPALAVAAAVLAAAPPVQAQVRFQTGLEFYGGSNALLNITPWIGARVPLSGTTSLLIKYYHTDMRYDYPVDEGVLTKRRAVLNNLTGAVYHQKGDFEVYGSASFLAGTDGYLALALDTGLSFRLVGPVFLEFGGYALAEDSILWFPDSPHRTISVFALRGGLKIKASELASFNVRYYAYRNSDQVNAWTLAAGVILNPGHPLAITLYYYRYSESAQYRFSGNYFSAGLSLYY